jgi:hypothetical protein
MNHQAVFALALPVPRLFEEYMLAHLAVNLFGATLCPESVKVGEPNVEGVVAFTMY